MPYIKQTWTDETPSATPIKYSITDDIEGAIATSAVIEIETPVTPGTPLNATRLNYIEEGIETAQEIAEAAIPKSLVTAVGDLIYATAAGILAALAKPAVASLLKMTSAGVPSWQDESKYMLPIGSVYIAVVSTNPATLLGYGTWAAFATGRMLTGIDPAQTEFDAIEKTGGSKTVTLTPSQMPIHAHNYTAVLASGAHDDSTESGLYYNTNAQSTGTTSNAGGGEAHDNLPPYICVYMWKRTA
jgi:microcystin-dependent protein